MKHPRLQIQRLMNRLQSDLIEKMVHKDSVAYNKDFVLYGEGGQFSLCLKTNCQNVRIGTKYCELHNQRDRHTGKGRKTNKIKGLKW